MQPASQGIKQKLIRTLGFARKEIASVLRQPRLVLTLIIGPFLILLVFGVGYRADPAPFHTLLVLESDQASLAADQEDLSDAFGSRIILEGTTTDEEGARQQLEAGEVDLLVIAPEDPLAALDANERSLFEVVHREVDPVVRSSINLMARLAVDEVNRRVLSDVVDVAQEESEDAEDPLATLRESAQGLVSALEAEDQVAADAEIDTLQQELEDVESRSDSATSLFSSVSEALGTSEDRVIDSLQENLDAADSQTGPEALQDARELEAMIEELEVQLERAQGVDPDLLVSPFGVEVTQLTNVSEEPGVFYSPGTLVLLVQHLAITFAALSLVSERRLGIAEVFRVSPLGPTERLAGKYMGFGAIAIAVSGLLTATMLLFGVQIRGSILLYCLVMALVIIASLGVGFLLSGVSQTDSQAVQYAMTALLLSIFFTGFVLPLSQLAPPVQIVSYLIPATYGVQAFHDIVFRGIPVEPIILAGLALYALVVAVGAWFVIRRDVVSLKD